MSSCDSAMLKVTKLLSIYIFTHSIEWIWHTPQLEWDDTINHPQVERAPEIAGETQTRMEKAVHRASLSLTQPQSWESWKSEKMKALIKSHIKSCLKIAKMHVEDSVEFLWPEKKFFFLTMYLAKTQHYLLPKGYNSHRKSMMVMA